MVQLVNGPRTACRHCRAVIHYNSVYCPHCTQETRPVSVPSESSDGDLMWAGFGVAFLLIGIGYMTGVTTWYVLGGWLLIQTIIGSISSALGVSFFLLTLGLIIYSTF